MGGARQAFTNEPYPEFAAIAGLSHATNKPRYQRLRATIKTLTGGNTHLNSLRSTSSRPKLQKKRRPNDDNSRENWRNRARVNGAIARFDPPHDKTNETRWYHERRVKLHK